MIVPALGGTCPKGLLFRRPFVLVHRQACELFRPGKRITEKAVLGKGGKDAPKIVQKEITCLFFTLEFLFIVVGGCILIVGCALIEMFNHYT